MEMGQTLKQVDDGQHPTDSELADMVRQFGVPDTARLYVAGRIDGTCGRKRGRPKEPERKRRNRAAGLMFDVQFLQAAFRIQRLSKPKERAIEIIAKLAGISTSRLKDILKRDLRDAPHLRPPPNRMEMMEAWVRERVEAGALRPRREAVKILEGLAPRYEEHHGVRFVKPACGPRSSSRPSTCTTAGCPTRPST